MHKLETKREKKRNEDSTIKKTEWKTKTPHAHMHKHSDPDWFVQSNKKLNGKEKKGSEC